MKKLFLFALLAGSMPVFAQRPDSISYRYIGAGTIPDLRYGLTVAEKSRFSSQNAFGDSYDDTPYGFAIQIARPASPGDNRYYLSFVRTQRNVAGMGFLNTADDVFGIQMGSSNTSTNGIFIKGSFIGINNPNPSSQLDVTGNVKMTGNWLTMANNNSLFSDANNMALFSGGGYVFGNANNTVTRAQITGNGSFWLFNNNTKTVAIEPGGDSFLGNGGLAINTYTVTAGYKLVVNGAIGCTKLKVSQSWADFVFDKNYLLPSLAQVEEHIRVNHKLPDIPSEKEIAANGLDVGEMQKLQMQKIEELTLYIIDLKKQLELQQKEINALKAR
jgi:hypothetical protein